MPIVIAHKIKGNIFLFFFALFLFCTQLLVGQTGNYYITNYSPAQYKAGEQNRGILQDRFKRIYVANLNGLLSYDGEYWAANELRQKSTAVSIDIDKHDRIFVGGVSEFGFISSANNGKIIYNSLNHLLPDSTIQFREVWNTLCTDKEVFFGSNDYLGVYDYNKLTVLKAPGDSLFHNFHKIRDKIFVRQYEVGFKVYKNKQLIKVEGSEIFASIKVRFIQPKNEKEFWVGTEDGMYIMEYNDISPEKSIFKKAPSKIDDWMINNSVYCATKLKNGDFIIGSLAKGIIHTDSEFNIIKSLNSSNGLQDDKIFNLYEDNAGNVWLALSNGITYVEINSPVTHWSRNDGIIGTIESSCIYNGTLFIGTNKGLQYLNSATGKFETTELKAEIWDLCVSGTTLLIGCTEGVYSYNGKIYENVYENPCYKIENDKINTNVVYIGSSNFLALANVSNNKVSIIKQIETTGEIRYIFQQDNKLYLGENRAGLSIVDLKNLSIKTLTKKEGLHALEDNGVFGFNNEILVGTDNGIYNIVNDEKLIRNPIYNLYPEDFQIAKPTVINNEIWHQVIGSYDKVFKIDEISTLHLSGQEIVKDKKYLRRIRDVAPKKFHQNQSLIYISTNNGLYCYDLGFTNKPTSFITILNSILTKKDTLLYNYGEFNALNPKIKYNKNDLEFNISATSFIDRNEMEFSYFLEGKDTSYCKWTKNNMAQFSNLHEGNYTFHAKSRDVLGNEGKEIKFSFKILPPWYRTTWAYIAYFILFVIVVWVIVALNTKRLRAQNIKLENTITERTKTIAHQMVEIEHKNKEITDSINYAKGIQDSILPDIKEIKKTWADTFVYFQPKDIVSGDFFWYKKINDNEFLIACADCTGHGVPGGFMSMICSDKLHDSAKESVQPKDILFGTNNGVKTTLKQEVIVEGKSKDGMEVCLLKVNTQTQEISYAGANRLLWIVDGETKELTEIKPTKASIASFTEFNFEYQQHDFKLKKGDIVYATSDGFPDQFGGAEGKKYMSKKMKAFILSICDLPMDEQHDLLKKEINDWMLGHEQVDDLLVIGVRL